MKKILTLILCLGILLAAALPAYAAPDKQAVQQTAVALGVVSADKNGSLNLGQQVSRAEFAQMLTAASVYKNNVPVGSGASPFKDVKYTHWAADYIKLAVDAGWMSGYVDGSFRPDDSITFEAAAFATLKMLGYEASDLTGTYPAAQIAKFKSLKLGDGISPIAGQALTKSDCMYIFYNLMGAATKNGGAYGVSLGYSLNSAGEIDYTTLVKAEREGPFLIRDAALASVLPFPLNQATCYRDGNISSADAIGRYDVYYYNANAKTVWAYSGRVIGVYTAAAPNTVAPSSITVAGNSYELGTFKAQNKVSATGEFAIGSTVALLLGMDGDVVDIVAAEEVEGSYYGVITKVELYTYAVDASSSNADYMLTIACTDGIMRQCAVAGDYYAAGTVVSVSYAKGGLSVNRHSSNLSGTVSSDGKKLGDYTLADNIKILDTSKNGEWVIIYPSRLSGVSLDSGEIRYYVANEAKEISHLILNDVTGDMYSYGILTDVGDTTKKAAGETEEAADSGASVPLSATYRYILNGTAGVLNTSNAVYKNIEKGPAIFYYKDGQISGLKNLSGIAIDELSVLRAICGNKTYTIADNVQVYMQSRTDVYHLTTLAAVDAGTYRLTGYYDTMYAAGGQIRVIIAEKK